MAQADYIEASHKKKKKKTLSKIKEDEKQEY